MGEVKVVIPGICNFCGKIMYNTEKRGSFRICKECREKKKDR